MFKITACCFQNAFVSVTGDCFLSHDIAWPSRSDIMPYNKIDKPLVVYRFINVT